MPNNNKLRNERMGQAAVSKSAKKASKNSPWRKYPTLNTRNAYDNWKKPL